MGEADKSYILSNITKDIVIDKNEVLRYLQYKGQNIDDKLNKSIDECIDLTLQFINPKFTYEKYSIKCDVEDTIEINKTNLKYESADIYNLLKDSREAYLMATTLGVNIERVTRQYSYTDLTKSLIIDACATTAIEEVCDRLQEYLNKGLDEEKKTTTMRYSPGYGDLDIRNNIGILEVLNAQRSIGLTITENGIMIPRKSVVAIMGVCELKYSNKSTKKSCENCKNRDTCIYKREVGGCANIRYDK